MRNLTLSDILDDLQIADQGLRRFERRYWISSDHFFNLYSHGLLDDGANIEDFAEWAGHYKLRQKRFSALMEISSQRVKTLQQSDGEIVHLTPAEPMLAVS